MACGADWGGYESEYDNYVAYRDYDTDSWYNGDPTGYGQWVYHDTISKDDINGDTLADQVAGFK